MQLANFTRFFTARLKSLIFYGGGLVVAKFLTMITQILIGRSQGAEFYGQFTLILILGNYISIPMITGWGLAFVQLVSAKKDKDNLVVISALKMLLIIILLAITLTITTIILFKSWLSYQLNINKTILWQATLIALTTTWWLLAKQIYQAIQQWYHYVIIEIIFSFFLVSCFLTISHLSLALHNTTLIYSVAFFISGLVALPYIFKTFTTQNNWFYAREIFHHGSILFINTTIGTLVFGIDRILININLGSSDVGVYQAHFLATYGIFSTFIAILMNYFFPLFSKDTQYHYYFHFKSPLTWFIYFIIIAISITLGFLIVWLYKYPISWILLITLSLFNAFNLHGQLYAWMLVGQGKKMTYCLLAAQASLLITNLILLILLLPIFGSTAAGISLVGGAIIFLFITSKFMLMEKRNERII